MFYTKPANVRYVDMAIYIDEHIKDPDLDEDLAFQYIYFLIHMLARKRNLFTDFQMLDDFAIYLAGDVFMRLRNPSKNCTEIKSVLNYIKQIIYFRKLAFEGVFYKENEPLDHMSVDESAKSIYRHLPDYSRIDFSAYVDKVHNIIKKHVDNTPYKPGTLEKLNLYISCLLSFLSLITPASKDKARLSRALDNPGSSLESVIGIYSKEEDSFVILYHLDKSMHNLVATLTLKARKSMCTELSELINYWQSIEDVQDMFLTSEIREQISLSFSED